jgi:uncharacterized coiled-coil protein SlyX
MSDHLIEHIVKLEARLYKLDARIAELEGAQLEQARLISGYIDNDQKLRERVVELEAKLAIAKKFVKTMQDNSFHVAADAVMEQLESVGA